MAESWNGVAWRLDPTQAHAHSAFLTGVSCSSMTSCIAVGSTVPYGTAALMERWDGATWKVQAFPRVRRSDPSAVSCSSASACTAVGSRRPAEVLAERWDGAHWSVQTPLKKGLESDLTGVDCSSSTACTAVGDSQIGINGQGVYITLAEHWDGSDWTIQGTPNPATAATDFRVLNGLSCISPSACTAVGEYNNGTGNRPLIDVYGGSRWTVQRSPNPVGAAESVLNGISCTAVDACTAVGEIFTDTTDKTLAEEWNGIHWVIEGTP